VGSSVDAKLMNKHSEEVSSHRGQLRSTIISLLDYCKTNEWAGFDPYDALNSKILEQTPLVQSRVCRIAITQVLKRLPINLRPLLLVPRLQNPKGIALFLMSFLKLSKLGFVDSAAQIDHMVERLVALRSPNTEYWCWGYSFPWQTRTVLVPRWAPNLVCTCFVGNALLDLYERTDEQRYLAMAVSSAEYILNKLYWNDNDSKAGFSYPTPSYSTVTYNASFLGAAFLCRISEHTGDRKFLDPALMVARYSASKQAVDGSWYYGEQPTQKWIDNFHTGYNLCALHCIGRKADTSEFEDNIKRGYEFYWNHFFTAEHAPRYFHDRIYPLDTHCVSQSLITLLTLKEYRQGSAKLAGEVFRWTMENLWSGKGYFYYQSVPFWTNRISYMRWSQAWMLLALVTLLEENCHGTQVTD
jgi:hypothetical protein